jgi:hypothetical protein
MNTKSLYGDELLVAAFGQFPPRSRFKIVDESDVVSAFYRASELPEFAELFNNYPFDLDGLEPRSSAISEGLDSLQQSRLLGRMNPDLIDYTIDPALQVRYERYVKPKLAGKEAQVQKLGEKINEYLHIIEPSLAAA